MKDGIIEQIDTPANIVLNPATEYVRKFTQDVPREKVLKIEAIMDPYQEASKIGKLRISKDALIETVAESILSQAELAGVTNEEGNIVGVIERLRIIKVLFGDKKSPD